MTFSTVYGNAHWRIQNEMQQEQLTFFSSQMEGVGGTSVRGVKESLNSAGNFAFGEHFGKECISFFFVCLIEESFDSQVPYV